MAAIHMRMLGYSLTLAMHGCNLFVMTNLLEGAVMEDQNIRTFTDLYKRFFTVWTITLQIFFAGLGLTTDYLTLKYSKGPEPRLLGVVRSAKNRLFAAVVWPTVFLVSTMFWSLYHYDRSLIYPDFADKLLTRTANHVFHTAVVPVVIWEVLFQPRLVPKTHGVNMAMLAVYMFAYLGVMCQTYFAFGIWMYSIFGLAYDSVIYFPLVIGIIGVALYIYYRMQWTITRIVWGTQIKVE